MVDQCVKLGAKGIKACYLDFKASGASRSAALGDDDDDDNGDAETDSDAGQDGDAAGALLTCIPLKDVPEHVIIYAHPETLLNGKGRSVFRGMVSKICAFVVDEAHIILEWYVLSLIFYKLFSIVTIVKRVLCYKGEDFRPDFKRVGEYLLPLIPDTPVLCFTATAPPAAHEELKRALCKDAPVVVVTNPNRPNIMYTLMQRPPSKDQHDHLDSVFGDILNELKDKKLDFPQTQREWTDFHKMCNEMYPGFSLLSLWMKIFH
jgi:ATP-dependent DNA helicase RecQ